MFILIFGICMVSEDRVVTTTIPLERYARAPIYTELVSL